MTTLETFGRTGPGRKFHRLIPEKVPDPMAPDEPADVVMSLCRRYYTYYVDQWHHRTNEMPPNKARCAFCERRALEDESR